jgi:hypothetical protein
MKHARVFSIKDPVFKTEPLFVLGCSQKALCRYLKRKHKLVLHPQDVDVGVNGQMYTFARPPWRVVWTKRIPTKPAHVGVLLHEIFHLVTRISSDKGIPIHSQLSTGEFGDESAAYLFEFFAVASLKRLSHRKRSK